MDVDGPCVVNVCTPTTSGAQTVTGTNGDATGMAGLTVAPGELDHFGVIVDGNQTAGTTFDVTVTAYDEFENVKTDYVGGATLSGSLGSSAAGCGIDGADPCSATYGDLIFSNGVATGSVTGFLAETGAFVTVTDAVTNDSNLFDVAPGELDHLVLTPASDSPTAGTDVTYEAEGFDAYGNSRGDVTDDTTFDDGCRRSVRRQRLHPDDERCPDRHRDQWRRDRHGRSHRRPG